MPEPIIPRDQVVREAQAAAHQYRDVNDACPYPFMSDAGQLFRATFQQARTAGADQGASQ